MLFWNCVDLVHEAMNLWTYEAMNQQNMCLFDHSLKVLYNSVLNDLTASRQFLISHNFCTADESWPFFCYC